MCGRCPDKCKCHCKAKCDKYCKKNNKYRPDTALRLVFEDGNFVDQEVLLNKQTPLTTTRAIYGSSFEPYITINPKNPLNIIAVDYGRSTGLSNGARIFYSKDGGRTFNIAKTPFASSMGPVILGTTLGDFCGDPDIVFDPDGVAYFNSIGGKEDENRNIVFSSHQVFKSTDGGASWSGNPYIAKLRSLPNDPFFIDKTKCDTNRFKRDTIYGSSTEAVDPFNAFPVSFYKSSDKAATWTKPFAFTPANVPGFTDDTGFQWGSQVTVLKDKSLILTFRDSKFDTSIEEPIHVFHSNDDGETWTLRNNNALPGLFQSITWDGNFPANPNWNPGGGAIFRDGQVWMDIAINTKNGYLYIVTQDSRFNPDAINDGFEFLGSGSVIIMSKDGGFTWTEPIPVNPGTETKQGFVPTVAVADNGTVGVLFYDFRFQNFETDDGTGPLKTDIWLAMYDENLSSRSEVRVTPESFDSRLLLSQPFIFDVAFYVGDYLKVASVCNDFVAGVVVSDPEKDRMPYPLELRNVQNFDASTDVNLATDTITIVNHLFADNQQVIYCADGGDVIGGLVDGKLYYVTKIDDDNFQLREFLDLLTPVDLTSVGSGIQTMKAAWIEASRSLFKFYRYNSSDCHAQKTAVTSSKNVNKVGLNSLSKKSVNIENILKHRKGRK